MMEIYTKAEMIYIWLGHETPVLRRAMDCFALAGTIGFFPFVWTRGRYGRWQKLKFIVSVLPPFCFFKAYINGFRYSLLHNYRDYDDYEEFLNQP